MSDFEITVDSTAVSHAFERFESACADLRPAMRDIGGLLGKLTEENIRAQRRPLWDPIAQATILQRLREETERRNAEGIRPVPEGWKPLGQTQPQDWGCFSTPVGMFLDNRLC